MTAPVSRGLDDRRVQNVLADAEVLHSAVRSSRGPHLTPTAVSWEADRLWAVVPRDSVKFRALRHDSRIGVLLSVEGWHVVATGVANLIEPLDLPHSGGIGELLRAPFGAARYLAENTRHTLGVVLDDPNPFTLVDRAGLSISLYRLALLHRHELVDAWGDWPDTSLLPAASDGGGSSAGGIELPPQTPSWAARLVDSDGEAQFGWRALDGPLALPARWSAAYHRGLVNAELMAIAGALPAGPACVTQSRVGYRMNDKTGVLLRGTGAATLHDEGAALSISPTTVTHWRGKNARTLKVAR